MNLSEHSKGLKEAVLVALITIRNNREAIERSYTTVPIGLVHFDPYNGLCANLGVLTRSNFGRSSYYLLETTFSDLNKNPTYPVDDEDFYENGNMWRTTNPTHNAKGRWELLDQIIEVLEKDLDSD